MPDQHLTASKLAAAIAAASAVRSELCDELIAAGRGEETHSFTSRQSDPLSLRYVEACDAYRALFDEKSERMRWHGTMNPIRKLSSL